MERPVTHDFALSPLPPMNAGAATASWHLLRAGLPFSDTTRLQTLMRGYGHRVSVVHGLAQIQARLADDEIDVLLHGSEHLALLESMSRLPSRPARICLVDGADARSRIEALDAGADDCLSRPYAPRELLARVAAVLRRRGSAAASAPVPANDPGRILHFGAWRYETAARRLCTQDGTGVELSPAEGRLLMTFLEHPNAVLERERLLEATRGRESDSTGRAELDVDERSIDLLVSRLRQKMRDDPRQPRGIRTIRGVGYLLEAMRGI